MQLASTLVSLAFRGFGKIPLDCSVVGHPILLDIPVAIVNTISKIKNRL